MLTKLKSVFVQNKTSLINGSLIVGGVAAGMLIATVIIANKEAVVDVLVDAA